MLYELSQYFSQFHSGFNVFQYLTLRSILGVLTALTISLIVGPRMIRYLSSYNIGQSVRDDGPESHFSKAGTPTMGGALILVAIVISTILWSDLSSRFVWVVLFVTVGFGCTLKRPHVLWETGTTVTCAGIDEGKADAWIRSDSIPDIFNIRANMACNVG